MSYKFALASLLLVGCVDGQGADGATDDPDAAPVELTEVRVTYANAPAGTHVVFQDAADVVVADVPLVAGEAVAEVPVGGNVTVISGELVTYLLGVEAGDHFTLSDAELTDDLDTIVVNVPSAPDATTYRVSAACAAIVDGELNEGYSGEVTATAVDLWVPGCAGASDLFVEALDGGAPGGFLVTDVDLTATTTVTGTYVANAPVAFTATNLPTDRAGQISLEPFAGTLAWPLPGDQTDQFETLPTTATVTAPLPVVPDLYVRAGVYIGESSLDYRVLSVDGPATALPSLDVAAEVVARLTGVVADTAGGLVSWTDDGANAADLVGLDYGILRLDDQGALESYVTYRAMARATAAHAVRLPVLPADLATYNVRPGDAFDRLLVTTTRAPHADAIRASYFTPDLSDLAAVPAPGAVVSRAARFAEG